MSSETQARDLVRAAVVKGATQAALNSETDATTADVSVITNKVLNEVAPVIVNATNNEPWWQSRVMWGSIVAIAAPIVAPLLSWYLGSTITIDADEQANISAALAAAGAALGGLFAIYGRFIAKKPIGR